MENPVVEKTYIGHSQKNSAALASPKLTRHDNHNLEFKILHEFVNRPVSNLEISVLFPSSIELSTGDKQKIFNDFMPRYKKVLVGDEFIAAKVFLDLKDVINSDLSIVENQKKLKYLGALIQEHFRFLKGVISWDVPEQLTLQKIGPFKDFVTQLNEVRLHITKAKVKEHPVLQLFEFYFHYLAIEFLSKGKEKIAKLPEESAQLVVLWEEFEASRHLKVLCSKSLRGKAEDQEERLIELSHAKKFFQSQMFIKSKRTDMSARLAGPLATFGAFIAGLSSSLIEWMSSPMVNTSAYQSSGLALVGIGIGVYTFRDRLKDQARTYLWSKLSSKLYDKQSKLIFKKQPVANAREWLTLEGSHKRDELINVIGQFDPSIVSKAYSIDDLMIYKKSIVRQKGFSGQIQEVLRFNFERHLKHFDDRRKKLSYFSTNGELVTIDTHRVYNLYVRLSWDTTSKYYKVIMDKKGIDRVIPLTKLPDLL